jgi:hypothetical protein
MKNRQHRQHRCSGIPEYRQILYCYNPQSAFHFSDPSWEENEMRLRQLAELHNRGIKQ